MDFVEPEEFQKNTGSVPYQIRYHKDKTVELIVSLKGGCVRIWGQSEMDVIKRYRNQLYK